MDRLEKSKTSFVLFVLFIVLLVLGGNYLIKHLGKKEVVKEEKSIKLEEDKDYFYNVSNECLSVAIPICYPQIKININSEDAKEIEAKLNKDMSELDRSYTKISEIDTSDQEIMYPYDDIYSAKTINYASHVSAYILSISVSSYDYYATGSFENNHEEVYNFSLKNGKLLNNDEVLKVYDLTIDDVIKKINKADITKLESYNIMVDENNNLIINYVANGNEIKYNDSITIYN